MSSVGFLCMSNWLYIYLLYIFFAITVGEKEMIFAWVKTFFFFQLQSKGVS